VEDGEVIMSKINYQDEKSIYTENGTGVGYKETYDFEGYNNSGYNKETKKSKKTKKPKKEKSKLAVAISIVIILAQITDIPRDFFEKGKNYAQDVMESIGITKILSNSEENRVMEVSEDAEWIDISQDVIIEPSKGLYYESNVLIPIFIDASSYAESSEKQDFIPENINDFDTQTAWAEGVEGNGVEEWIELGFESEIEIREIAIDFGNKESEEAFDENGLPQIIRIEFSDNRYITIENRDVYDYNDTGFVVLDNVVTSFVRIVIETAEENKNDNTCISEVTVFGE
jgi:hypothetical protein